MHAAVVTRTEPVPGRPSSTLLSMLLACTPVATPVDSAAPVPSRSQWVARPLIAWDWTASPPPIDAAGARRGPGDPVGRAELGLALGIVAGEAAISALEGRRGRADRVDVGKR